MNHVLFPAKAIRAWQGGEAEPEFFPAEPLEKLLRDEHSVDAYTTSYIVVDPEGKPLTTLPRLGKDCLSAVRSEGGQVWMRVVAVDLDRNPHEPWEKPEDARHALEMLGPLLPHAAMFATRRGVRAIFKLQQLVSPEDFRKVALCAVREVDAALRRVSSEIRLDLDDTCAEWTRLWGLPHVVRDGTNMAPLADMRMPSPWAPWFPGSDALRSVTSELDDRVANYAVRGLPAVPPDPGEARQLAMSAVVSAPSRLKIPMEKVLRGARFYAEGGRNPDTYKLLAAFLDFCLSRGHIPTAEEVYGLFYASVAASTGTAPLEALSETWGMIQRAVARAEVSMDIERRGLDEALAAAVDRTRISSLIYTNKTRWVWHPINRTYGQPISNDQTLLAEITRHHPIVALDDRGKIRPVHAMLRSDGVFVWQLRYVLGRRGSGISYDSLSRALLDIGVASLPQIPPIFHQECSDYLDTIVSNSPDGDRFLDWICTAGDLGRATTALLLRGRPSAGKTMIADALAQLFGGKASFSKVMGRFNAGMLESALIHLEEGIDDKGRSSGSPVANRFREVVGGSSIAVEQKGIDPVSIVGNYRVIITSNNPQPIPVENARNLDDFRAISLRVLPIYMGDEPQAYLHALGGRPATDDWVERDLGERKVPGKLSEHFAWLAENRVAKDYRDRFLVPAEITPWHVQHLLQGVLRDTLIAIGVVLGISEDDTVVVHEGKAWVQGSPHNAARATSIVNRHSAGKYEHEEILQAITVGLADGPAKRIAGKTYYPMPTDVLLAVMEPEDPEVFLEDSKAFESAKRKLAAG